MINETQLPEHQYFKRSCLNCNNFLDKSCHAYNEHISKEIWSNKARYGCIYYVGEFSNEKSKKQLRKEK